MKLNPGDAVEYRDIDWPMVPGWNGKGILKTGLTEDSRGEKGYYLKGNTEIFVYIGHIRTLKRKFGKSK